jgi:hypothetical protein
MAAQSTSIIVDNSVVSIDRSMTFDFVRLLWRFFRQLSAPIATKTVAQQLLHCRVGLPQRRSTTRVERQLSYNSANERRNDAILSIFLSYLVCCVVWRARAAAERLLVHCGPVLTTNARATSSRLVTPCIASDTITYHRCLQSYRTESNCVVGTSSSQHLSSFFVQHENHQKRKNEKTNSFLSLVLLFIVTCRPQLQPWIRLRFCSSQQKKHVVRYR